MHQALADVLARLDQTRRELGLAVEAIPVTSRDLRPGPHRWSVAEIVEHLALVEVRYTTIVADSLVAVRRLARPADGSARAPLPERVETLMANRSALRPAPEPFLPTGVPFDTAWTRAGEARAAFRALLMGVDGLALHEAVYDHPRFGALNAHQWVEFVAAHERRHIDQVRENAAQLHDASQR